MNGARFFIELAPECVLLVGACLTLIAGLGRAPQRPRFESLLALVIVLISLFAALRLGEPNDGSAALGLWLTPITFYARVITLSLGVLFILVNWRQPASEERGEYMAMILFSLLGVLLTASANDLIVLFFAVELVSIPTYVLIALSRLDQRASEATLKYFFLGALSAAVLAYGLSFLYGAAGTTEIHRVLGGAAVSNLPHGSALGSAGLVGLLLVIAGLAFKIAAVPLHVYAPDVYEGAAAPVTGLLGFVPKFAGFVALVKVLAAIGWAMPGEIMWVLWLMAAATMTLGNVVALLQSNVKRMLAYSSIAHTGYMLLALLVGPVAGQGPMHDGVAALFFYMAVYGAMNLGAFALLAAFRVGEREAETLDEIGGIAVRAPLATLALAVCVFSLTGLPPTAGFLGKLYIFSCAFSLNTEHAFHGPLIALAIIGVLNAAIGAAYYLRIVAAAYMGRDSKEAVPVTGMPLRFGLVVCGLSMLLLFAWPVVLTQQARNATLVIRRTLSQEPIGWKTVERDRPSVLEPADGGGSASDKVPSLP